MKHALRLAILTLLFCGVFGVAQSKTTHAVTGADFRPGRIIDDVIFTNKASMTPAQIQLFLESKVAGGSCDTDGSRPSTRWYAAANRYYTHAEWGALNGNPAPFVCLTTYRENPTTKQTNLGNPTLVIPGSQSAAEIIYNAGQQYNINPQVLLVLLQKEQSLLTDDWPWLSQYQAATGAYCPDSGPGGSANCDPARAGFGVQVREAARLFRYYMDTPFLYFVGNNNILFNPNRACGTTVVNIENLSTAALYHYTPYQPNAAALNNLYGTGDGCSAYGNRNFWRMFNDWFGTTYAFNYQGVDYFPVFDPVYYLNSHSDVRAVYGDSHNAAFDHFINYGMREGRLASTRFDVNSYRNRYPDLRWRFGKDLSAYYLHYITNGMAEGRISTGSAELQPVTDYSGVDYGEVYDYLTYLTNNSDLSMIYTNDDTGALWHFVNYGMAEGRIAKISFSANSYRTANADLRFAFQEDWKRYYLHFLNYGKFEGRIAIGNYLGGTTSINNTNYAVIYSFDYYDKQNSDILRAYGLNDTAALQHFVNYGMAEGRIASANFNVTNYKNRYPDLRSAFGNDLKKYYLHFLYYGAAEGRSGI